MLFCYDDRYDLIREVKIVEVKTGYYRVEDGSCYIGFVYPNELFNNLPDIMKYLNKTTARVSYMNGQASVEITI